MCGEGMTAPASAADGPRLSVGILCYPSVGGSGIVATELGRQLARRGHRVHVISSDQPFRLRGFEPGVSFHQVDTPNYPVFKHPPYVLTLANKVVQVARTLGLDIIHAHYAIPHATAAFLAREMLQPASPRVVTTLHGTDVTLFADDPSFADSIRFAIERSDAVTAVSRYLVAVTHNTLGVARPIEYIPNFLECADYERRPLPELRARFAVPTEAVVVHMSNFRKVKRPDQVVRIFAGICRRRPARLLMVGDGPELCSTVALAEELGVGDRVFFLGNQEEIVPLLSIADLFLLPSLGESFGLAAAEAMACGTPVVASCNGGLREVIEHGRSGFVLDPDDIEGMIAHSIALLADPNLHRRVAAAGRRRVHEHFCAHLVVPAYEQLYQRTVSGRGVCWA